MAFAREHEFVALRVHAHREMRRLAVLRLRFARELAACGDHFGSVAEIHSTNRSTVAPVFTSIGGGCGIVFFLPAMMATIALPIAAHSTINSKVMGTKAGHEAFGLPPKFIGQSHTIT